MSESYRHELKYYISLPEYELLSRALSLTMKRDRFAQKTGGYFIRSLYFDDYEDRGLWQKLDGVDDRDKYRIRAYNFKEDDAKLERKHKSGQYILKSSLNIVRAEAEALSRGDFGFLLGRREPFAHEMYAAFRLRQLKPRVIVDYWREPYTFPVEDVRVTFDQNIRTAFRSVDMFNRELPTYPAQDEYGMVLEIKFNKFLPAYIHSLLQPVMNAQHSAVSKYVLCRKYE